MATKKEVLSLVGKNAIHSAFLSFYDNNPRNMYDAMEKAVYSITGLQINTNTANALLHVVGV